VWEKIAGVAEPTNIQVDNGTTNTKRISIHEFADSEGGIWEFKEKADNDSGSGSTSPLSTGTTANVADGVLLVLGAAMWRDQSEGPESINWTSSLVDIVNHIGVTDQLSHSIAWKETSTGEAFESQVSWTGTGHEASAGILVFNVGPPEPAAFGGIVQTIATGIAAIVTAIVLTAPGLSEFTVAGDLTTTTSDNIESNTSIAPIVQGNISTFIPLQGSITVILGGFGNILPDLGKDFVIVQGGLNTQVALGSLASGVATVNASLTGPPGSLSFEADIIEEISAAGDLATGIQIEAASLTEVTSEADLLSSILIEGAVSAQVNSAAYLQTPEIPGVGVIEGSVLGSSVATGSLTSGIALQGFSPVEVLTQGDFSTEILLSVTIQTQTDITGILLSGITFSEGINTLVTVVGTLAEYTIIIPDNRIILIPMVDRIIEVS
jgi:hypothetical protein